MNPRAPTLPGLALQAKVSWVAAAVAAAVVFSFPVLAQNASDVGAGAAAADDAGRSDAEGPDALGPVPDIDLVRAPDRTPKSGTPLISNVLHPMQNVWEVTGFFDFSYANKYVDHLGGHGALTYHIFDWLAVEGFGGYLVGDETNIASKVRQTGQSANRLARNEACATELCEPELPDLWQTTWFAGADLQWAPIYGKLSVVSEYDLNFQLYGMLGGGVEGIRKRLNSGAYDSGPGVRLNANYGLGLRFIPWKWVALRLELRNYTGVNGNVEETGAQGIDECETGYTLQVGGRSLCNTDFSNNAMVQLGVSFLL